MEVETTLPRLVSTSSSPVMVSWCARRIAAADSSYRLSTLPRSRESGRITPWNILVAHRCGQGAAVVPARADTGIEDVEGACYRRGRIRGLPPVRGAGRGRPRGGGRGQFRRLLRGAAEAADRGGAACDGSRDDSLRSCRRRSATPASPDCGGVSPGGATRHLRQRRDAGLRAQQHRGHARAAGDLQHLAATAALRLRLHLLGVRQARHLAGDCCAEPTSYYGVTKLAAEQLALAYWREGRLPVCAMRLYSVYGPRERPDKMFSKLIMSLLAEREFPCTRGVGNTGVPSPTWETRCRAGERAGTAQPRRGRDLQHWLRHRADHRGSNRCHGEDRRPEGAVPHRAVAPGRPGRDPARIEKARTLLGYAPRTTLEEGLERQVAWCRENFSRRDE